MNMNMDKQQRKDFVKNLVDRGILLVRKNSTVVGIGYRVTCIDEAKKKFRLTFGSGKNRKRYIVTLN